MVPTAVLTMTGKLKHSEDEAVLSSPEEEVLNGTFPVLIGHPESWGSDRGQVLLRELQSRNMIQLNFIDEMHQESLQILALSKPNSNNSWFDYIMGG